MYFPRGYDCILALPLSYRSVARDVPQRCYHSSCTRFGLPDIFRSRAPVVSKDVCITISCTGSDKTRASKHDLRDARRMRRVSWRSRMTSTEEVVYQDRGTRFAFVRFRLDARTSVMRVRVRGHSPHNARLLPPFATALLTSAEERNASPSCFLCNRG